MAKLACRARAGFDGHCEAPALPHSLRSPGGWGYPLNDGKGPTTRRRGERERERGRGHTRKG